MEVNHGRGNLFVTEESLEGVEIGPVLSKMSGVTVTERMNGSLREVEFSPGGEHETLERAVRHRFLGLLHPFGQFAGIGRTATGFWKEEKGIFVKAPILSKILDHGSGDGDEAIFVTFPIADPEFVFLAPDVVDGEGKTFGEAQTTAVDQLEGSTVSTEANVLEQLNDLIASEDGRKFIVVLGFDFREDFPILPFEHVNEEEFGGSNGLADSLGLPLLDVFDKEEVVAKALFGDELRVHASPFVNEAHVAVIGMAGAGRGVAEAEKLGEPLHDGIGMVIVIDGVALGAATIGTSGGLAGLFLLRGTGFGLSRRLGGDFPGSLWVRLFG